MRYTQQPVRCATVETAVLAPYLLVVVYVLIHNQPTQAPIRNLASWAEVLCQIIFHIYPNNWNRFGGHPRLRTDP